MPWADMCTKGGLTTGTEVQLAQLCGHTPNAALITGTGLPVATTLAKFVAKAQGLRLKDTYTGISFNIVHGLLNGSDVTTTELYRDVQKQKEGAAVCFEDAAFFKKLYTDPIVGRHILVHQSLAPCKRCRGGYKVWAQNNACTIVLSADEGYDGTPANAIFVFSPSGTVYYVK